jgi:hypothetical protein
VTTCTNSCHSTSRQLTASVGRARGESIVNSRPKQIPRCPVLPGRPIERTMNSS